MGDKGGTATCPAGKTVVGGGYIVTGFSRPTVIPGASYPSSSTQWSAEAHRTNELGGWGLKIFAVCVKLVS